MKRFLILVLFALISQRSDASSWAQLDEQSAVDTESIAAHGNLLAAWFSFNYGEEQPGLPSTNFKRYVSMKYQEYFNCERGVSGLKEVLYYSSANALLGQYTVTEQSIDFEPVVPGTLAKLELDYVCRSQRKK